MKLSVILPLVGALALFASAPVSASIGSGNASPPSMQRIVVAAAATTDWAKYCRTIRNRPHRQQCQQEHGVPYSK